MTSQAQPEPKRAMPAFLNSSLKESKEPKVLADRRAQLAARLAAAVGAHHLPEERVVVVAAGVVADRGLLVAGQAPRGCGGRPRRRGRPTRCPRGRRWLCRRRPGGVCRGGCASSPRRCEARARRRRTAGRVRRKPSRCSLLGFEVRAEPSYSGAASSPCGASASAFDSLPIRGHRRPASPPVHSLKRYQAGFASRSSVSSPAERQKTQLPPSSVQVNHQTPPTPQRTPVGGEHREGLGELVGLAPEAALPAGRAARRAPAELGHVERRARRRRGGA